MEPKKECNSIEITINQLLENPCLVNHDMITIEFLCCPENIPFVCKVLVSPALYPLLDFTRAEIYKTKYIDDDARKKEADVIYKIAHIKKSEDEADFFSFILIEHKTVFDAKAFLQTRGYQQDLYQKIQLEYSKLFPVYSFIIIQSGENTSNLESFIDVIIRDNPLFDSQTVLSTPEILEPKPVYLSQFTDDVLGSYSFPVDFTVFFKILRDIKVKNFGAHVPELVQQLKLDKSKPEIIQMLSLFWIYMCKYADMLNEESINQSRVFSLIEEGTKTMATLAEKWLRQGEQRGIEQGKQQGIEQGVEQGKQQTVLRVLLKRFAFIPDDVREKILNTFNSESLDNLIDGAYCVTSIEEFSNHFGE